MPDADQIKEQMRRLTDRSGLAIYKSRLIEHGIEPADFDRWGPIYYKAYPHDESISESNYQAIIKRFKEAGLENWREFAMSHWAWGSIDEIFIEVHDKDGRPTPIFELWLEIVKQMEAYPLLDEDDFSARGGFDEEEDPEEGP